MKRFDSKISSKASSSRSFSVWFAGFFQFAVFLSAGKVVDIGLFLRPCGFCGKRVPLKEPLCFYIFHRGQI